MAQQAFSYYTDLPNLLFKEYGRSIQGMVEHLLTVEDRKKRTEMAYNLVELMRKLHPQNIPDTLEDYQKLWDHLHIMAGFKLEIDGPFPTPDPSILNKKPKPVPYPDSYPRFKHYGYNVELIINKAKTIEDPQAKENAIIYLGRLMKNLSQVWNNNTAEDNLIIKQIGQLSKGALDIDADKVFAENLFESAAVEWQRGPEDHSNSKGRDGGRNRPMHGKNNRHNNKRRRK